MGTMFVWSSPVLNYLDPDYCPNYHCDLTLTKQEAVWVNAIAFFGCIFSVPMAGEIKSNSTIMIRRYKLFLHLTRYFIFQDCSCPRSE